MSHPRVKITVSEPVRISPLGNRHWFPRLFVLPDGRIIQFDVSVDDATEALREENGATVRIADANGLGWREIAAPRHFSFPVTLKNGVVRAFSYITWQRDDGFDVTAAMADFNPVTETWTERGEARISLPQRTRLRDQQVSGVEIDRSVILEPDGSLLATMYGHLDRDEQMRTLLVRSEDDGLTWNFVSTIADVGTVGKRGNYEVGYEGFCEPVMIRARDGSLLVVMRTGGYDPMFQTRSFDDGKTWEAPINLGALSVDPDLCMMSNGVLACSFGRPTVQLMFSLDGSGDTWTAPQTIYSGPRVNGRENSTCYTGLRQVADGRLLLVYDTNSPGSPWEATDNQINAVFIDVEV
jgi:hypothetical protein